MEGLFDKFKITKTNGDPIDEDAKYFVLRIDNDPHARTAIMTWCNMTGNQELYEDILNYAWNKDKEDE